MKKTTHKIEFANGTLTLVCGPCTGEGKCLEYAQYLVKEILENA